VKLVQEIIVNYQ